MLYEDLTNRSLALCFDIVPLQKLACLLIYFTRACTRPGSYTPLGIVWMSLSLIHFDCSACGLYCQ